MSKIKQLADLVSGEDLLPGIFLLCPMWQKGKRALWGLLCKGTNPIYEGPTLPIPSHQGLRFGFISSLPFLLVHRLLGIHTNSLNPFLGSLVVLTSSLCPPSLQTTERLLLCCFLFVSMFCPDLLAVFSRSVSPLLPQAGSGHVTLDKP